MNKSGANKWIYFLIPFLFGFSANETIHDTPQKVTDEFRNVEQTTQPKQWRVFFNTPTLTDLEDYEVVNVSTNGWSSIMWRHNIDIFAIKGSCVTVVR